MQYGGGGVAWGEGGSEAALTLVCVCLFVLFICRMLEQDKQVLLKLMSIVTLLTYFTDMQMIQISLEPPSTFLSHGTWDVFSSMRKGSSLSLP